MSASERWLICEATFMLGLARLVVLIVPFRIIAPLLRYGSAKVDCDRQTRRAVRQAVTVAARNVPWNAVCLPQALAAKAMLARRGYGSTFYLGATIDRDGKLIAHAWLVADGEVVVGAAEIPGMVSLVRFG